MAMLKSLLMSTRNREYNPMCEDGYDGKIPLHNDQAFQNGIHFKIKFVGSYEVPKPTSRGEIIAAMRRIRCEFKTRSIKKRQVNLTISVDGIKVCLWKKNKKELHIDESRNILIQHPIYRVFYVSHDSQDLKIFSFIARDNTNNTFRCNVFKAYKKNEAMHIVRTIGQAFEVCHKLSLQKPSNPNKTSSPTKTIVPQEENETPVTTNDPMDKAERYLQSVQIPTSPITTERNCIPLFQSHSSSEFTLKHQMQFMQEQLQQMQNESELAFNQIKLIKEQLNIEIASRIDSQNKNKQLIERNRELLTHIQQLLIYTHELEMKLNNNKNFEPSKNLSSRPTDLLLLPTFFSTLTASSSTTGTSNQQDFSSDSPDSGKGKEISSESISDAFLTSVHDHRMINSSNRNNNNNNNNNCTSIADDITAQSISINDTVHCHDGYSSTSSSCSSIRTPNKNNSSQKQELTAAKSIEHYLYDRITPLGSASFTNSAFSQSPLRQTNKDNK